MVFWTEQNAPIKDWIVMILAKDTDIGLLALEM